MPNWYEQDGIPELLSSTFKMIERAPGIWWAPRETALGVERYLELTQSTIVIRSTLADGQCCESSVSVLSPGRAAVALAIQDHVARLHEAEFRPLGTDGPASSN